MRLQKYMAKAGVASRRKSEEIITEGRVKVNDVVVKELGTKVNVGKDKVKVDNVSIRLENHMVYILLNKPIGYVSTLDDEKDRKIITDLIDNVDERIYPVGRLDIDSTGAMLLTNDGDLTYKITHPKNEVKKTYVAIVEGRPNRFELEKFRNGINLDGEITAPAEVKILKSFDTDSILEIIIHEGKNRQVRRMCEAINHPVKKLKRVSIGKIELGDLREGHFRHLNDDEIEYLKNL